MRPNFCRFFGSLVLAAFSFLASACGSSSSAPPGPSTQSFVGPVDNATADVGVVVTGGKLLVFFCGNGSSLGTLTHWMRGTVSAGQPFSVTDGTASASGSISGATATGMYSPGNGAATLTWTATSPPSGSIAGVYAKQLDTPQGLVDLIVLQASATATPDGLGAFHDLGANVVSQVTPYDNPIMLSAQGVAVKVPNVSSPVFLTAASAE